MKIHAKAYLDAVGPIVDRLAVNAFAFEFGYITEREYEENKAFYLWLWQHTPVR